MSIIIGNVEIHGRHGDYTAQVMGVKAEKIHKGEKIGGCFGVLKKAFFPRLDLCLMYALDCHLSDEDRAGGKDVTNTIQDFKQMVTEIDGPIREFKRNGDKKKTKKPVVQ